MNINLPKGTKDFLGNEIDTLKKLESMINNLCKDFVVQEIRTPIFEHTELFIKSTGETTDIVQKEMYTFNDRGGRSLTLKPEGTPPVVRALINYNLLETFNNPTKLYYITPLFRCERPQAGRMRQFHQFGVEFFGSYSPISDAEVISMAYELFNRLKLNNIKLYINSLGCKHCRPLYIDALKNFLKNNINNLCSLCASRYEKNPLRTLDCKNDSCKNILSNSPIILDFLDDDCKNHFSELQNILSILDIPFIVNARIVRGLDYYSRTVFEFISDDLGAQSTLCGGGRYDSLVENTGGNSTGAIGFGMGIERLLILLKDTLRDTTPFIDVFIGYIGTSGMLIAQSIALNLRKNGISVELELLNRSVKSQLKYANKINAEFSIIIGDSEISDNLFSIKNMHTGEIFKHNLQDLSLFFINNKLKSD